MHFIFTLHENLQVVDNIIGMAKFLGILLPYSFMQTTETLRELTNGIRKACDSNV